MTSKVRPSGVGGFNAGRGRSTRERPDPGVSTGRPLVGALDRASRIVRALMRPSRVLPALLAFALLAMAPPARAAYNALEEIPVESPVYKWVEDLATSYSLSSSLLLTRPWTRAQLGEFLDQLVADQPNAARDPVVHRLRRELEPGGGLRGGFEPMGQLEQENASIELSPYVRLGYAEDKARSLVVRDDRVGSQASVALGEYGLIYIDAYVGPTSAGSHGTPVGSGSFNSTSTDLTAWFDRAYATWATKGFSVRAGHTWLRWGPGSTGTLSLSEAAPAFDLIEATARFGRAAQLGWIVGAFELA